MSEPDQVVLVVGPPLSGAGGVIEGLRSRLPDVTIVGVDALDAHRAPDAVVAVVSAVAAVTRSDWAIVGSAGARTDLLVGVVSKIDAHRGWRDVVEADRMLVAQWEPRAATMPWVGVAAAPGLGEPRLDELVGVLRERLADPDLRRRNEMRSSRPRSGSALSRRPVAAGSAEVRTVLQRTRLRLLRFVRDRCTELRGQLRDVACAVPVGGSAEFAVRVRNEADRFVVELHEEIDCAVASAATELVLEQPIAVGQETTVRQDLPDVTRPPAFSRRLEGRLMAVLGVGFGLGIALASSRLLAGMAPGLSVAGLAVGAVAGFALMVWVVRARGLLHERALLDRWVTEVGAALRWHGESVVAERLLAAESAWAVARDASGRASTTESVDPRRTREDVTEQYEW